MPSPFKTRRGRRHRLGGFTLVEVLVAFAILAGVLGALFGTFSSGLTAGAKARQHMQMVMLARSLLERVGPEIGLQAGQQVGETDAGLAWRIEIRPAGLVSASQPMPIVLYAIEVTVSDPDLSPLTLSTLRLGPGADSR